MEGGGGLAATDLKDATFTLSNVGAIGGGGTFMSPIITPPQIAIGALGQIRRLPRFVAPSSTDPTQSQTIEEAHICAVSWAADHRIVDGATVARFHKSFKEYMEDPIKLLLELR
jgi:2-oxoisovalerate dehydrogenase E2 component (dihydrolipoyl transacylase)